MYFPRTADTYVSIVAARASASSLSPRKTLSPRSLAEFKSLLAHEVDMVSPHRGYASNTTPFKQVPYKATPVAIELCVGRPEFVDGPESSTGASTSDRARGEMGGTRKPEE
jgi:hypothetical protein